MSIFYFYVWKKCLGYLSKKKCLPSCLPLSVEKRCVTSCLPLPIEKKCLPSCLPLPVGKKKCLPFMSSFNKKGRHFFFSTGKGRHLFSTGKDKHFHKARYFFSCRKKKCLPFFQKLYIFFPWRRKMSTFLVKPIHAS